MAFALKSYLGSIASATSIADYAATVDGLAGGAPLAHWRLSEAGGTQITDRKAGARHGTYAGTVGFGVPGLPQSSDDAVDFGGTGTGQVDHDAGLELSAFSLSFWFRLPVLPGENEAFVLVAKDQTGFVPGNFAVMVEDGGLIVRFQSDTAEFQLFASANLETDTTYHLVVRADGTGFDAYLNGKHVGTSLDHADAWTSNTQPIRFATAPGSAVLADVVLDEIALYPRVLSETEVIELSQITSAPVAIDDAAGVPESTTTVIDVTANDSFVGQKAGLTVEIVSQPGGGDSVAVDGDNDMAYTAGPVTGDTARSFSYRITDLKGTSDPASVNVTVQDSLAPSGEGLCYVPSGADTVEVASPAALAAAVAVAPPGRNILVAPGTYGAATITLDASGTEADPIVIRPRDGIGTVTFDSATWDIDGNRLVISGIDFNSALLELTGAFHRVTRCRFRQIDRNCIRILNATDIRVDHCDFADYPGSANAFRCVYMRHEHIISGAMKRILVDYCHFHDMTPGTGVNGQEIIGSSSGDAGGFDPELIIDHCLFENIDIPGEGEVISSKMDGAKARFCTFDGVALYHNNARQGANWEVRSCWFEDMSNPCLNVWGDNHLIIGNRLIGNLNMRIGAGDHYWSAARQAGYAAARNCRIVGNVLGTGAIQVGGFWGNLEEDVAALDNNLYDNTGTISLDPIWQTGTTTDVDNEPYVAAVKLTASDVGLNAGDPLCG